MPSFIGTALVKVVPDTTGFAAATAKGVEGAAGGLAGSANKVGKAMTLGITGPVVGIGVAAVQTFRDFEKGMLGVQAVTGASGAEFDSLRNKAKELGASTQFSAGEAAAGMEFLGMAGFDTNQILEATPGILDLAAAGGLSLAAAADGASNVLQGFGKEASEINKINDELAYTAANSNTSVQQLVDAMSFAAPVAKGLGVESAEAAAHIGILSDAGIQGGRAGTSMARIYADLANTTGPAAEKMAELGISTIDSQGKLLAFDDIVGQFGNSTANASDIMQIFGKRGGPAMLAILERGSQDAFEFAEAIDQADGAAKEMADIRMSGIEGAILKLKSAWEGFLLTVAESGLVEAVAGIATAFTSLFSKLANLNPELVKTFAMVAMIAAAIGPLIMLFVKLTNPIFLISALIAGLIGWFTKLINGNMFLKAAVVDAWTSLTRTIQGAWSMIQNTFARATEGTGEVGDAFGTKLVMKLVQFTNWLADVAVPAITLFAIVWIPRLIKTGKKIGEWISKIAEWITGTAIPAIQKFASWLGPKLAAVGEFIGAVVKKIAGFFQTDLGKATAVGGGAFAVIWGVLAGLGAAFVAIMPIIGNVILFFGKLWKAFGPVIRAIRMFVFVFRLIGALMMANPITILIAVLVGLGIVIWQLWKRNEDFRLGVMMVWEAIKGFGRTVAEVAVSVALWVANMAQTVWRWMQAIWSTIVTVSAAIWNAIVAAWNLYWLTVTTVVTAIWNTVVFWFTAIWNTIVAIVTSIWNSIVFWFNLIWSSIVFVATNIWSSVVFWFNLIWTSLVFVVTSIWTSMVLWFNIIKDAIMFILNILWGLIVDVWELIKASIIDPAVAAYEKVVEVFTNAKDEAIDIFNGLLDSASSIWDSISSAIGSAVDTIISLIDSILGPINSVMGAFTDLKNTVSNFDIGSALGGFGNIPFFAKGGLVTSPTLGMVGEAGPELILPLSDKARMRELLTKAQPFGTGFALNDAPSATTGTGGAGGLGNTYNFNGVSLSQALMETKRMESDQLAGSRS